MCVWQWWSSRHGIADGKVVACARCCAHCPWLGCAFLFSAPFFMVLWLFGACLARHSAMQSHVIFSCFFHRMVVLYQGTSACQSLSDWQSVRLWERTSMRDSTARTTRTLEKAAIRLHRRKRLYCIWAMWPSDAGAHGSTAKDSVPKGWHEEGPSGGAVGQNGPPAMRLYQLQPDTRLE